MSYKFIIQFAGEFFFNQWTFGEVTNKMVVSYAPFALGRLLSSKMQNSPDR